VEKTTGAPDGACYDGAMYKFILGFIVLAAVAGGGYYTWQYNASHGDLANLSADTKFTDEQVSQLTARIGRFLVVPANEKPSVVVIRDVAQLAAQQSFYAGAKDGDILVVYSTRAIIYDAKTNKLVNVGPIVRNTTPPTDGTASPSATPSLTPTPTPLAIIIDVRNGTATAGLAGATASELKKNKLFTIGAVGDAKSSYHETVVVDLTKNNPGKSASIAQLAAQLKVSVVTTLPSGEATTTSDALVIVGK
jgi:hypothetical protein